VFPSGKNTSSTLSPGVNDTVISNNFNGQNDVEKSFKGKDINGIGNKEETLNTNGSVAQMSINIVAQMSINIVAQMSTV
jgi:hypothetical protein